ncbi:MAG: hypothetical protein KJZ84_14605 [Bryobacteraceae bacterium]|nr:hypothetical protein [Bryobacteraceae bacterium]
MYRFLLLSGFAVLAAASSQDRLPDGRPVIDIAVSATPGEAEDVMLWRRDSCRASGGWDLPDVQARAMRQRDGTLVLYSGNAPVSYAMKGSGFHDLRRDCEPVLVSGDQPSAHSFANQEWLLAIYREGGLVHGLVHNEYHDPVAPNCKPGVTDPSNLCWYNAITYTVSADDGKTFRAPAAPERVVAALPAPWDPNRGVTRPGSQPSPHGYFTPSNIVPGGDGYYYSLFFSIPNPERPAERGVCLMRTAELSDPSSWRAWDGRSFGLTMWSPYARDGAPSPTGLPPCAFVDQRTIGDLHGSLTYNAYLGRWLLVGSGVRMVNRQTVCGTYFSTSVDMLNWAAPQLLLPGKLPHPPCAEPGQPDGSLIYPSLIDHADDSPNFENTGQTPHLYYVRWNQGLNRDLLRRLVRFESRGAVANLASGAVGRVAPGLLVTITGRELGPAEAAHGEVVDGLLGTEAGGTRAYFDGVAAPVIEAEAGYVAVAVPYALAGRSRASLQVQRGGRMSAPVEVDVAQAAPGVFTLNGSGTGQALAVHIGDGSVNSVANPIAAGGTIALYVNAGGPAGADGALTGHGEHPGPVEAEIAGLQAEVVQAAPAPGLVAGVLRVVARVPEGVRAGGAAPVLVRVMGEASQAGVTIAVKD